MTVNALRAVLRQLAEAARFNAPLMEADSSETTMTRLIEQTLADVIRLTRSPSATVRCDFD